MEVGKPNMWREVGPYCLHAEEQGLFAYLQPDGKRFRVSLHLQYDPPQCYKGPLPTTNVGVAWNRWRMSLGFEALGTNGEPHTWG